MADISTSISGRAFNTGKSFIRIFKLLIYRPKFDVEMWSWPSEWHSSDIISTSISGRNFSTHKKISMSIFGQNFIYKIFRVGEVTMEIYPLWNGRRNRVEVWSILPSTNNRPDCQDRFGLPGQWHFSLLPYFISKSLSPYHNTKRIRRNIYDHLM